MPLGRAQLVKFGIEPRRLNRVRFVRKLRVLRDYNAPLAVNLGYVIADPEVDNFTYDLLNEDDLVCWIADQFDVEAERVALLLVEGRSNRDVYERLHAATSRRLSMKTTPALGRRLGWYVIIRLLRPERVIETGIHDGIGSLILLAALDRNRAEGCAGELVSTDVDRTAGWIVGSHPHWSRRILSHASELEEILDEAPFQMFLHDSLHTADHERFELAAAARRMEKGVLLSDNSHVTTVLRDVCAETERRYAFWHEQPRGHFYPGGGIGLGLSR